MISITTLYHQTKESIEIMKQSKIKQLILGFFLISNILSATEIKWQITGKIIEDKTLSEDEVVKRFDSTTTKIKFKAFGKVTINNNRKESKMKERTNTDNTNMAQELFEEQEKKEAIQLQQTKRMSKKNFFLKFKNSPTNRRNLAQR